MKYGYDASGRLSGVDYSDPNTPDVTGLVYDKAGRLLERRDGSGRSKWAWDSLGRLESHVSDADRVPRSTTYGWDVNGNMTRVTYPNNKQVTYGYDAAGRAAWLEDWVNGRTTFGFDDNNNLNRITHPAAVGTADTFGFDRSDRETTATYAGPTQTLATLTWDHHPSGDIASEATAGLPAGPAMFGHDALGRLTALDGIADQFRFDTAGNLTRLSDGTKQVHNLAGQLCWTSPTASSGECNVPPADATTFNYDTRGNRTSQRTPGAAPRMFGYDQANRLTSVSDVTTAQYRPLNPARVLDTRDGTGTCDGGCIPIVGGTSRTVTVAGKGGVPATGAQSVAINITVVAGGANGFVTAYPSDKNRPNTSNVNFNANQVLSNTAIVPLGPDGKIKLYGHTAANVIVDVSGWYGPAGPGAGVFKPLDSPTRVVDTRPATRTGTCDSGCTPLTAGVTRTFTPAHAGAVPPSGVDAVVLNVTVVAPQGAGQLYVYPSGNPQPLASNLNYSTGDLLSQMVIAKVGTDGKVSITSPAATDVVVDVFGYFTSPGSGPEAATGFTSTAPTRLFDTRTPSDPAWATCTAQPAPCDRLAHNDTVTLQVTKPNPGLDQVPAGATAVAVNLTVVGAGGDGWLKAYPADQSAPVATAVNFQAGETVSNSAILPLSPDGKITFAAGIGAVDVIVDLHGYFNGTTWTYAYNADGLRTAKTAPNGATTSFTWSQAGGLPVLLSEHRSTGVDTNLVYGPGGLPVAEIDSNGTTRWYHHDQLGSTRMLTNSAGATLGTYTYSPYGTTTAPPARSPRSWVTPAITPTARPDSSTCGPGTMTPRPASSFPGTPSTPSPVNPTATPAATPPTSPTPAAPAPGASPPSAAQSSQEAWISPSKAAPTSPKDAASSTTSTGPRSQYRPPSERPPVRPAKA